MTYADNCYDKQLKNSKTGAFSEVEHVHDDPVATFEYVPVYKSAI